MKDDLGKRILEKIEKEQVQPYSRWRFILQHTTMWSLFVLSLLLGSLACGVVIFQLTHTDWNLYRTLHMELTTFLFFILPYFWLAFLLGFTGFAYFYFRRTRRGYRYPTIWLISGSILLSLVGGVIVYKVDLAERLETAFRNNIAFYRMIQERKTRIWVAPEKGLLAGEIIGIPNRNEIRLKDFKGNIWQIDVKNALWRGWLTASKGLKVKIIGQMEGQNSFTAREIRPWQGHGWRRFFHQGFKHTNGQCNPKNPMGLPPKNGAGRWHQKGK